MSSHDPKCRGANNKDIFLLDLLNSCAVMAADNPAFSLCQRALLQIHQRAITILTEICYLRQVLTFHNAREVFQALIVCTPSLSIAG